MTVLSVRHNMVYCYSRPVALEQQFVTFAHADSGLSPRLSAKIAGRIGSVPNI